MKKINTKIKLSLNKETISIIDNMNTIRGGAFFSDIVICYAKTTMKNTKNRTTDTKAKLSGLNSCQVLCQEKTN